MNKAIDPALTRIRRELTAWYLVTLALLLLLLGGGLFLMVRRQIQSDLDASLQQAVVHLGEAAAVRERERGMAGSVMDAVDELRIPDRTLYLLRRDGAPIRPDSAPAWVRQLARAAGSAGPITRDRAMEAADVTLRAHAAPIALPGQDTVVGVAVADRVELEDRYASLLTLFGVAAVIALGLVAVAGNLLVRQSLQPVARAMDQQRRFMADAAHELRTPLSVLRGRAEVALQHPRDAATYQTALHGVATESAHLGRIVEDLFTLAQVDAGQRTLARERLFLDDIVLDAADGARVMAVAKGLTLEVSEFEEAPMSGDAHALRQLVMILLDNAIKFTPAGASIAVRVGCPDGRARLQVRDSGCGIAPAELPHLFERFYRGDQARTRAAATSGGAGLGLSIAHWIVASHGGAITLSATPGEGTIATVTFPAP